jgi:hypothetical protein
MFSSDLPLLGIYEVFTLMALFITAIVNFYKMETILLTSYAICVRFEVFTAATMKNAVFWMWRRVDLV